MIPGSAVYHVVEAMAPLYTAAVLGYASVRWLKAFSDEQCAGINHFVALYAVPVLIFHMVSTNNPYHMNERLIAADTLQKVVILLVLMAWGLWNHFRSRRSGGDGKAAARASPLKWVVTTFSMATLPNTIIMGVPLLDGMYGDVSGGLMKQIVVLQFCIWYNVVIFLYEFMAARDGSAKISPESPLATEATVSENCASHHEVAVNIEITEVAAAASSTPRDRSVADGTMSVAKELSGSVTTEEVMDAPLPTTAQQVPSVMHVVWMAGKKLLKIPNTYASFLGLIWSLVAFKAGIKMPKIVDDSLFTIYTTAVGLSMFASGTFIARQSRFVPCGYTIASLSMVVKFLIGPVIMLLASLTIGLHGTLLRIAVVQAALPLAVTSFVYAEEYKVHADIMSTGVILGIFISLPVTIVYYILMGL
ncbi:probable auxin efflux carrier component 9 [Phragmites australis]|uniref:probable auxin efflux carrier component 9 n=1 Tax=Phragmites australis TaxID=29695 RepID=UPI002D78EE4C|nr:probable auxin efflux carrier component 9 [Phragmites australis]